MKLIQNKFQWSYSTFQLKSHFLKLTQFLALNWDIDQNLIEADLYRSTLHRKIRVSKIFTYFIIWAQKLILIRDEKDFESCQEIRFSNFLIILNCSHLRCNDSQIDALFWRTLPGGTRGVK